MHGEDRNARKSIIRENLVELVRARIMDNRRFTFTELSHFPLLVPQNCHGAAVQKIVRHVAAKTTDTRTQSKTHGVSVNISAVAP